MTVISNNSTLQIWDENLLNLESAVDVYPGEREQLAIAARFDDDGDCYGWSNESYYSEPKWRNPNRRLFPGRYLAKVTVVSSGRKCSNTFRVINDVSRLDFRLEPPQEGDSL
jgi:hypothetical protein